MFSTISVLQCLPGRSETRKYCLDVAELRGKRVKSPCGPAAVSEEPKPMPYIAAVTENAL